MAICGCSNGLLMTAVVALVVLPAQYLVPELGAGGGEPPPGGEPLPPYAWLEATLGQFPPLDLLVTLLLILLGLFTYLCEWIHTKIMERRIIKLNQYLMSSVERLRAWDVQQEQLEKTLKLVQNATSEYNLLLYLLLRPHRALSAASNCFFDKGPDDVGFLSPAVNV